MIVAAGLLYLNVRTVVIPDGMATQMENGFPTVFWSRWGILNSNGTFQTVEEGFYVKFLVLNIAVNAVILVATIFVLRRLFAVNSGKVGNDPA